MRHLLLLALLPWAAALSAAKLPNDSTGMAGDNFSLAGALELFRQAKDLDGFVQALNTSENGVNNLDLDADGQVDFVHVHTIADGDARVVVLRVQFTKEEAQDVASIQMERSQDGAVILQIRGDDALYPEATILEPTEAVKEGGRGKGGPLAPAAQVTVWVNVWAWPCVQWCYGPSWWDWNYPWYWGYYPPWWRPWNPWGWNVWWGYQRPYWGWYHPVAFCRVERAHNVYMHRRAVSPSFGRRNAAQPQRTLQPADKPKPARDQAKPMDRGRTKESAMRPERKPSTKPSKRPERQAPSRTAPPSRQAPPKAPAPSRPPTRAPGRR